MFLNNVSQVGVTLNHKSSTLILFVRMIWLISLVIFGLTTPAVHPEIVEPGPNSGIVLKKQPVLLITN